MGGWDDKKGKYIFFFSFFEVIAYGISFSEVRICEVLIVVTSDHEASFYTIFLYICEDIWMYKWCDLLKKNLLELEFDPRMLKGFAWYRGCIDSFDDGSLADRVEFSVDRTRICETTSEIDCLYRDSIDLYMTHVMDRVA